MSAFIILCWDAQSVSLNVSYSKHPLVAGHAFSWQIFYNNFKNYPNKSDCHWETSLIYIRSVKLHLKLTILDFQINAKHTQCQKLLHSNQEAHQPLSMTSPMEFPVSPICKHERLRSGCVPTGSNQELCCSYLLGKMFTWNIKPYFLWKII